MHVVFDLSSISLFDTPNVLVINTANDNDAAFLIAHEGLLRASIVYSKNDAIQVSTCDPKILSVTIHLNTLKL